MSYKTLLPLIVTFLVLFHDVPDGSATIKNGFDLSGGLIKSENIHAGGPKKDGIPALSQPRFHPASQNNFLRDDDRVLGIAREGTAKAYPIRILNWHEIVNDLIDDVPFVITYCPLCGTGVAFSSTVNEQTLEFGVSGLLYNNDVLLYDRQSESLWSQILGQAVTGDYAGEKLEIIPIIQTSWKRWKTRYPDSLVLSKETGFTRDYNRNPYGGYEKSRSIYFPVTASPSLNLHPKETVLGITIGERHKAYPFTTLMESAQEYFIDTFNGTSYKIYWDEEGFSAQAYSLDGILLPTIQGFWFAWYAFHPDTELYQVP